MFALNNRETDLVTFKVLIDGVPVETQYPVMHIDVTREVNRIPAAKIIIADGDVSTQDFPASSSDTFIPGKQVELRAGYHSQEETIFKGIIIKHSIKADRFQPPMLIVECRDEAVKMTSGRKSRAFHDMTDSDLLQSMVGEYGLQVTIDNTSVTHEKLVQYHTTDWDFINIRAEANKLLVFVNDGTIEIKAVSMTGSPLAELAYGSGIIGFEAEIDARSQYQAVKAKSWSSKNHEVTESDGVDPALDGPGNLGSQELSGVIGLESLDLKHAGQVDDQELQVWADTVFIRSQLARNRGMVTIQGRADIIPGGIITLSGLGDRFNGNAYVTGVKHEIDGGNWLTHARFGLDSTQFARQNQDDLQDVPASGLATAVHGLQVGIITALQDDPQGEERVKVRLPLISPDEEGIWARLATLDAGNNRGSIFRPEIDDEVIVGFMNDDPDYPIVLGQLHSSASPTPVSASDDNHEKGFVTREGMKVWFNDEKKIIEISTPAGNKFFLDEDQKEIRLEDQNGNKMKFSTDGITLESAKDIILKATGDLKAKGINIEMNANAQFKAKANAAAEISSSGTMVVKGSLVQIN